MVTELKQFGQGYSAYEDLFLFLGTLAKFNGNEPVENCEPPKYVEYFAYRWKADKNLNL